MNELAGRFESSVGSIVSAFSAAATELEASASTMSETTTEATQEAERVSLAATGGSENIAGLSAGAEAVGNAAGSVLTASKELNGESDRLAMEVDNFLRTVRGA